jgi:hypothetical protein
MNRITRAALLTTAAIVSLGIALPTWADNKIKAGST